MRLEIKGVHYDITDVTRSFLQEKLEKIEFAADQIIDLVISLTKGKKDWTADATVNFKFGVSAHITETDFNLHESIEKMIDRLEQKIKKEKEKIQDHYK